VDQLLRWSLAAQLPFDDEIPPFKSHMIPVGYFLLLLTAKCGILHDVLRKRTVPMQRLIHHSRFAELPVKRNRGSERAWSAPFR
jgi:hypothetical protein